MPTHIIIFGEIKELRQDLLTKIVQENPEYFKVCVDKIYDYENKKQEDIIKLLDTPDDWILTTRSPLDIPLYIRTRSLLINADFL
jgi:hypothetical protein